MNLVAGGTHLRFRGYLIGTTLAMVPGTLGLVFAADRVLAAVRDPGLGTIAMAAGLVLLVVAGTWWARRRVERSEPD